VKLTDGARAVLDDFQRLLVVDDAIAGYAYFDDQQKVDYLLHPRDKSTGLKYSALPMIHAIANGMLTLEQAEHHLDLIDQHLLAPDGVRLFDRPMTYRGGEMKFFQRAETATFFGREIGLMYTHAHLRYVEALARYGDADHFFDQLCRANPIHLQARVPSATRRQSNCYYSSSDAVFRDRYQALDEYAHAMNGTIAYEGGWRIYSSGAGISVALVLRCLLGLRREATTLVIDPVLPPALNGLHVEIELFGKPFEIVYHVGGAGCGVNSLMLNGAPLTIERESNPYRVGGAAVERTTLQQRWIESANVLEVTVG
jgi:cellobiose phosphorylase